MSDHRPRLGAYLLRGMARSLVVALQRTPIGVAVEIADEWRSQWKAMVAEGELNGVERQVEALVDAAATSVVAARAIALEVGGELAEPARTALLAHLEAAPDHLGRQVRATLAMAQRHGTAPAVALPLDPRVHADAAQREFVVALVPGVSPYARGAKVPHRVGWRFVERLGGGGFGEVWLVANAVGRRHALKLCLASIAGEALKLEGKLLERLQTELGDHPQLVAIHDMNLEQEPYWIAMDAVLGGTLADRLRAEGGAMPWRTAVDLMVEITRGVAAAHAKGIVHRDLKPGNILFDERERPRIADFGIGKSLEASPGTSGLTMKGYGTAGYVAPEQAESEAADPADDVYSLGVILWQLLRGSLRRFPPRRLADGLPADVPAELLALIDQCLDARERRPQDANALGQALGSIRGGFAGSTPPRPTSGALRRRATDNAEGAPLDVGDTKGEVAEADDVVSDGPSADDGEDAVDAVDEVEEVVADERLEQLSLDGLDLDAGGSGEDGGNEDAADRERQVPAFPAAEPAKPGVKNAGPAADRSAGSRLASSELRASPIPLAGDEFHIVLSKIREGSNNPEIAARLGHAFSMPRDRVDDAIRRFPVVLFECLDRSQADGMKDTLRDLAQLGIDFKITRKIDGIERLAWPLGGESARTPADIDSRQPGPTLAVPGFTWLRHEFGVEIYQCDAFAAVGAEGAAAEFALIPAGSFRMGGTKYASEQPVHVVTLKSFLLARTALIQRVWAALASDAQDADPSHFKGEDRPVEQVLPDDVRSWCRSNNLRLPSEAEWEYACRAGSTTEYGFGDDKKLLGKHAWYSGNSKRATHPVAQQLANAFGLFDMHGNVWELCQDDWNESHEGAPTDGSARSPPGSASRVIRGGGWCVGPSNCYSARRSALLNRRDPVRRFSYVGFRPAADISEEGLAPIDSDFSVRDWRPAATDALDESVATHSATPVDAQVTDAVDIESAPGEELNPKPWDSGRVMASHVDFGLEAHGVRVVPPDVMTIPGFTWVRHEGSIHVYRCEAFAAAGATGPSAEFVLLPAGVFDMGTARYADSQPVHRVTVRPFLLARTLLTQRVYEATCAADGNASRFRGPNLPVEQVTWNVAAQWCRSLGLRLPSEAEWEFACRAGSTTAYGHGDDDKRLGDYAWFKKNSGGATHEVGQKASNAWGFYDMHGNVFEWCEDHYFDAHVGSASDGSARLRPGGTYRVYRGGGWSSVAWHCQAAVRRKLGPHWGRDFIGLRPAATCPDVP